MLLISITIIEHDDLFFGAGVSTEKPELAMLQYIKEVKKLLIKFVVSKSVY